MRPRGRLLATIVLALTPAWPASATGAHRTDGGPVEIRGALAWVLDDDLDLVGDLAIDLAAPATGHWTVHGRLDTETAISRAASDLRFLVREMNYRADVGVRREVLGGSWGVLAGQIGRANVDVGGSPWARWIGGEVRATSAGGSDSGLAGGRARWTGSAGLGAVVDRDGLEADAIVRGALAYRRPWGGSGWEVGLDLELDGVGRFRDGGGLDADLRVGPRIGRSRNDPGRGTIRYDVFVHLLRGRNPFGLRLDGAIVGLDIASRGRFAPTGASWWRFLNAGGSVATGAGDRDGAGRFTLWIDSPDLVGGWRASVTMDPNVVAGDDVDELYWLYHVGLQRRWGAMLVGGWFFHRSNHTWSDRNPVGVTSLNVFEIGGDSEGWDRVGGRSAIAGRWGALDVRLRVGALIDSSFGERRRWHLRAGLRWTAPFAVAGLRPFAETEREDGDVARTAVSVGARHRSGVGGRIEWRRDEQWFGADDDATLGLVEVRF